MTACLQLFIVDQEHLHLQRRPHQVASYADIFQSFLLAIRDVPTVVSTNHHSDKTATTQTKKHHYKLTEW